MEPFSETTPISITLGFAGLLLSVLGGALWQYFRDRAKIKEEVTLLEQKISTESSLLAGKISSVGEAAYMAKQEVVIVRKEIEELKDANSVTYDRMARIETKIDFILEAVKSNK